MAAPDSDRTNAVAAFKRLTEIDLPRLAAARKWPIRLDHCFKRICLDNAFAGVWHEHLQRPAQRHIQEPQLGAAIAYAEQILDGGQSVLERLNQNSLTWRGKLGHSRPKQKGRSLS